MRLSLPYFLRQCFFSTVLQDSILQYFTDTLHRGRRTLDHGAVILLALPRSLPHTQVPMYVGIEAKEETSTLTSEQRIPSNSITVERCKETSACTEQPRSQHLPTVVESRVGES